MSTFICVLVVFFTPKSVDQTEWFSACDLLTREEAAFFIIERATIWVLCRFEKDGGTLF